MTVSLVLERLQDPDPRVRDRAVDDAGDYLRGNLDSRSAVETAVAKLVAAAVATHDPAARPIIASYATHPDASVRGEVADPLVESAGS